MPKLPLSIQERHRTMQQIVYDDLVVAIRQGQIPPGETLAADVIAQQRGCSRTPVREALRRLEMEGLVAMRPHQRAVVATLSETDLREIYEVRLLLEPQAARLAARNATENELREARALWQRMHAAAARGDADVTFDLNESFHEVLYGGAHQHHIVSLIVQLRRGSEAYRRVYALMPDRLGRMVTSRRDLLEACEAHDAKLAESLVKDVLSRNVEEIVAKLREHDGR